MALQGISDEQLQIRGRWASNTFLRYIRKIHEMDLLAEHASQSTQPLSVQAAINHEEVFPVAEGIYREAFNMDPPPHQINAWRAQRRNIRHLQLRSIDKATQTPGCEISVITGVSKVEKEKPPKIPTYTRGNQTEWEFIHVDLTTHLASKGHIPEPDHSKSNNIACEVTNKTGHHTVPASSQIVTVTPSSTAERLWLRIQDKIGPATLTVESTQFTIRDGCLQIPLNTQLMVDNSMRTIPLHLTFNDHNLIPVETARQMSKQWGVQEPLRPATIVKVKNALQIKGANKQFSAVRKCNVLN